MIERVIVRRGVYHDSVTLMLVSRTASEVDGVERFDAVAATPLNLELLTAEGFDLGANDLRPDDLVIALRAADEQAAEAAVAAVERGLATRTSPGGDAVRRAPRSLRAAVRERPELALAFLSVPGRHVAYEGAAALEAGLHVFCFSDGASLEDEIALKRRALERGLLFLGPDCGTAIIDGVALGFANAVRPGPIGVVGASGTGIQQLTCLLDAAGVGISHAIGVGGRDLRDGVDGVMTVRALEMLAVDAATSAIVVISKPPDRRAAERVAEAAGRTGKPVTLAFLGVDGGLELPAGVELAASLEEAAARAAGGRLPAWDEPAPRRSGGAGAVRGLFMGGTLCSEAMSIITAGGALVRSNVPLREEWRLDGDGFGADHACIDFGADEYTEGRPHPMIDPSARDAEIERHAADPRCAVVLVDVVLGYGAHADPAGVLAPHLQRVLDMRPGLAVVVSLCGAAGDPQGLDAQASRLRAAGAVVCRSNAQAARFALQAAAAEVAA